MAKNRKSTVLDQAMETLWDQARDFRVRNVDPLAGSLPEPQDTAVFDPTTYDSGAVAERKTPAQKRGKARLLLGLLMVLASHANPIFVGIGLALMLPAVRNADLPARWRSFARGAHIFGWFCLAMTTFQWIALHAIVR